MMDKIDKRDRAPVLRARLAEAMAARGMSQAELARQTGVDRSTISALLQGGTRLPNAQLAADCARALGISADWLLGLSGRPEPIADLLAASLSLTEAPRALIDELTAFATASGYYEGLSADLRLKQLSHLITLCDQLYPSLRLCLFDARKLFSAPITVFGPQLAVIYLGRHYLAFRDSARVETITQHFDLLVREAEVGARDMPAFLRALCDRVR